MSSVHIDEIRQWRAAAGATDALPGPGGMFFEIRFDSPAFAPTQPDTEFAGRVITVDSPQGIVTITFDDNGWLKTLDIS